MIKIFVPMDRRHDNFYDILNEQRIEKLNKTKKLGLEDSLPFPTEPLRAAPNIIPRKRVSKTSSDSGDSPHVLSPATPVTPDNSQPYVKP